MSPTTKDLTTLELAQALAERLRIDESNWHKLKSNRPARAKEQAAAALVFLLKDNSDEALARFTQAVGWLDKSISAPPCPSHGDKVRSRVNTAPATEVAASDAKSA
jgi:Family of unknown function (DUF6439)